MRTSALLLGVLLLSASAAAEPRARLILLPESFGAGGISPDGHAVLGSDTELGGGAIWRKGTVRPLEENPANRLLATASASSRRARVAVGRGFLPGVQLWKRGRRTLLAPDGDAFDVSANGRRVVGFVREVILAEPPPPDFPPGRRPPVPTVIDTPVLWRNGVPREITAQEGFEALLGLALSASGRTLAGVGTFDEGPATRFLLRRRRAIAIEGLPEALVPADDRTLRAFGGLQLSNDGTTVADADVVRDETTCFDPEERLPGNFGRPTVCRRDLDFEAWRWRRGARERLDPSRRNHTVVSGISRNGEVIVGTASGPDVSGPYLWDPTSGLRSLSALLEALGADLQGFTLLSVAGISDDGRRIVGHALPDGNIRAGLRSFLAILPPACSDRIDNDGDGRVDMEDRGCRRPSDRSEGGAPCRRSSGSRSDPVSGRSCGD